VGGTREFDLDRFQKDACAAVDAGESVLVAAPTGAGKTVVAERAVELALTGGMRVFYTTPIKALSNQKFHDLRDIYGVDTVGLLTGDNSINGSAPIVVMTTEVLRNMIYEEATALDRLGWVILDEVHYLQDTYRGPVWEEVIIHLPAHVKLVCLSATVSNVDEITGWLDTVRGNTRCVTESERPVELESLFAVGDGGRDRLRVLPVLRDDRPNPEGERLDVGTQDQRRRGRHRRRWRTPGRQAVVDLLGEQEMLPAIFFIFSRAGCEDAMRSLRDTGMRLTSSEERLRIRAIVEDRVATLSDADLDVLGYDRWLIGLEAGVAAHHAGMVPPFKEAVEQCFVEGLVKVVFATETLALGINMPARSVVIEKLSKFNGDTHELLTPLSFTQLTGRAGRRGIDEIGSAMVLWSPFVSFAEVAALVGSRSFPLISAFRPTYNMAANLIRRMTRPEALAVLNLSLAQYQSDREVVTLEQKLRRRRQDVRAAEEAAICELGDVAEYERVRRGDVSPPSKREITAALGRLKPGAIIQSPRGASAVVLTVAFRRDETVRVRLVDAAGNRTTHSTADFQELPVRSGEIALPEPYLPNDPDFVTEAARRLVKVDASAAAATSGPGGNHPVAQCPDLKTHLAGLSRARRQARSVEQMEARLLGHQERLSNRFDQVLDVLSERGQIDGWALTEKGQLLAAIYHESDLLLAEALQTGVFEDLDVPSMAGLLSCVTYERRAPGPAPEPRWPTVEMRQRWSSFRALAEELTDLEKQLTGTVLTRFPDPGFASLAYRWADGAELDAILDDEIPGGDFVRHVKILIDLARQIGQMSLEGGEDRVARRLAETLHRGVVAASSVAPEAAGSPSPDA
jgi:ATP-dependent RNA helicase HelY